MELVVQRRAVAHARLTVELAVQLDSLSPMQLALFVLLAPKLPLPTNPRALLAVPIHSTLVEIPLAPHAPSIPTATLVLAHAPTALLVRLEPRLIPAATLAVPVLSLMSAILGHARNALQVLTR